MDGISASFSGRVCRAAPVVLLTLFVGMAVMAIRQRGPWYDELYTYYLVRPDAPLSVLAPAWMRDNHPPLFYALTWAWSRLVAPFGLADTVEGLRTINLVVLAAMLALLVRWVRGNAWWQRVVWYDTLALAAMLPAINQVDQLRSYFLSYVLAALVLIGLVRVLRGEVRSLLGPGIVLALAFSVHLVTTVIVAGLVAAAIVALGLARRWSDAWRLTLVATLAFVPFVVSMALQLPTMAANTRVFWIPGGLSAGRWAIETEIQDALTANPALALIALGGVVVLAIAAWRRDAAARATLTHVVVLGFGLGLGLAVLLMAHLYRPLLISRYLVAVDATVALELALLAAAATRHLRPPFRLGLDALALLVTLYALYSGLTQTEARPSWDGTARVIAQTVRQCPATRVYANLHWNAYTLDMAPRDNLAVVPFSYAFIAKRFGFTLSQGHAMALGCPTLFWTEHFATQPPAAQAVIDDLRNQGFPVRSGRMVTVGIGWVLIAN
jgi:hypothetical protein